MEGNPHFMNMESNEIRPVEKNLNLMKMGSFELDLTYAQSRPGLIRIGQIITVTIAFFCVLAGSSSEQWKNSSGVYIFCSVILAAALVVSFYTFFTLLAHTRSSECCGYSWTFIELVYFALFGGLIFLGSCLSANKANGNPALSASAAFGFISLATFGASFWIVWKNKKKEDKEKAEENNKKEEESPDEDNFLSDAFVHPDLQDENGLALQRDGHSFPRRGSRHLSARQTRLHSIGSGCYDGRSGQRRRFSASDKDSAFSEGIFNPQQDQFGPPTMRRSLSVESMNFSRPHMQRLPSCFRDDPPLHEVSHVEKNRGRRSSLGFPQRLATYSFSNMTNDQRKTEWDPQYSGESESQARSIPGWLRAALQDDELDTYDRNELHLKKRKNSYHEINEFSPNHSFGNPMNYGTSLRNSVKRKNYGTMPGFHQEENINRFLENEHFQPSHHSLNGRRRSRKEIRDHLENGYPSQFF